jgi:hypothetical protein
VRREQQEAINRNIFEDDCKWELCYENFKLLEDDFESRASSTIPKEKVGKSLLELKR